MRGIVVAPLLLAACSADVVRPAHVGWSVPAEFRFDPVFKGHPVQRSIPFTNSGQVRLRAELEVDAPFTLAERDVEVAGGSTHPLVVDLEPADVGRVEGLLTVRSGDVTRVVRVLADVVEPPDCHTEDSCRRVHFDPVEGRCVEVVSADGTSCESPCLVNPSCLDGACVGAARRCDDDNACTVDACEPDGGCVHHESVAHCPKPANPCRVATCEAEDGCGESTAPDGTVCGQVDCVTAHVCLLGACVAFDVPDGAPCGAADLCHDPGVCRRGRCEQTPARPLQPLWTYTADPLANLIFTGTVDGEGNLYFIEGLDRAFELVSLTRDGALRFRAPFQTTFSADYASEYRTSIVVAEAFVAVSLTSAAVEVFHRMNGLPVWHRRGEAMGDAVTSLAYDGFGGLVLAIGEQVGSDPMTRIQVIDIETGADRWRVDFEGYTGPIALDPAGRIYTSIYHWTGGWYALSLSRGGVERWRRAVDSDDRVFAATDTAVFAAGHVIDPSDGHSLTERVRFDSSSVHAGGRTVTFDLPYFSAPWARGLVDDSFADGFIRSIDWTSRQVEWDVPVGFFGGESLLATSAGGTLVVVDQRPTSEVHLVELSVDGAVSLDCPLGSPNLLRSFTALHEGRWFIASSGYTSAQPQRKREGGIHAFDVGARVPAARGWVSRNGHASGDRRAR